MLVECDRCKESVPEEDAGVFAGTKSLNYVCQYCLDDEHVVYENGEPVRLRFIGFDYDPSDQRAHERLENADLNLVHAIDRYLKNCPSHTRVRKIVDSHLRYITRDANKQATTP